MYPIRRKDTGDVFAFFGGFTAGKGIVIPNFTDFGDEYFYEIFPYVGVADTTLNYVIGENMLAFRKREKEKKFKNIKEYDRNGIDTIAIIGSGPSLNEHIESLKTRKDIITLGINRANGIHPWTINFVYDRIMTPALMNCKSEEQILVTTPIANRHLLDVEWKDEYLFNCIDVHDVYWKQRGINNLVCQQCTATSAIHFAWLMGFKRIELYGIDCAFDESGYHFNGASTTFYENALATLPITVNDKRYLVNDITYSSFVAIKMFADVVRKKDIEVVSFSGGLGSDI